MTADSLVAQMCQSCGFHVAIVYSSNYLQEHQPRVTEQESGPGVLFSPVDNKEWSCFHCTMDGLY